MATKQKQKVKRQVTTSRDRNWTLEETKIFADILSDVDLNFASTLVKKALKGSSNHIVYLDIRKELVSRLQDINESGNSTGEVQCFPSSLSLSTLGFRGPCCLEVIAITASTIDNIRILSFSSLFFVSYFVSIGQPLLLNLASAFCSSSMYYSEGINETQCFYPS